MNLKSVLSTFITCISLLQMTYANEELVQKLALEKKEYLHNPKGKTSEAAHLASLTPFDTIAVHQLINRFMEVAETTRDKKVIRTARSHAHELRVLLDKKTTLKKISQ